jgi:Putative DnaT-like ssDNA binding protein
VAAPPIILEDGTGLTNANSYVDVARIDEDALWSLFATPAWAALSADQKTAQQLNATMLVDCMVIWKGWKFKDDQALQWPRQGVYLESGPNEVTEVAGVPANVKTAQSWTALALTSGAWVPAMGESIPASGEAPVKSLSLGSGALALDFATENPVPPTGAGSGTRMPALIEQLLVPLYGAAAGAGTTGVDSFRFANVYRVA